MEPRRGSWFDAIAVFVLAGFLLAEVHAVFATSITYDEFAHVGAGFSAALHRDHRIGVPWLASLVAGATLRSLDVPEGPAAEIHREPPALAPYLYGERLILGNEAFRFPFSLRGADSVITAARLPLVLFPLLAAFVAWRWARARSGPEGGLLALVAVATYPDLLGHGALATNDASVASLALLAAFALDRLAERGGAWWLVVSGLALGGALAAKITGLMLLPALALAVALHARARRDPSPASLVHPFGQGPITRPLALALVVASALAVLVVWLAADGADVFARASSVRVYHEPARQAAAETGVATSTSFVRAVLLKTPLGTLGLLLLAIVAAARGARLDRAREATLLLPGLVIFVATSALATPLGSRYVLPAMLFLLVATDRLASWATTSPARVALVASLSLASVGSAVHDHPFHTSATNLLAGGERRAWARLDNSNLDWGQGLEALGEWQRRSGVPHVLVVPFGSNPYQLVSRPDGALAVGFEHCLRVAALQAYGVRGEVVPGAVLFQPQRGQVYAVSAQVAFHALRFDGRLSSPLVLGRPPVEPTEVVGGGFLIFDLRENRPRR